MASNIDDVVIVTVTKQSSAVSRQGFGTPLWIGQVDVAIQAARFVLYSTRQDLIDVGFPATHNAVKWAEVLLGGDTDPAQFAIGRRVPGLVNEWTAQITAPDVGTWVITIDTVAISFVSGAGGTNETIAAGLSAQANLAIATGALPSAVTVAVQAAPDDDTIDVKGTIGGEAHTVITTPAGAGTATDTEVQAETAPEVWATAFTAINTSTTAKQWYFLNIEDRDDATIATASSTVNTEEKIGVFQTSDPDVLIATEPNAISVLRDLSYKRVQVFWKKSDLDYVDAGMTGVAAAADLDAAGGQITWNLKTLIGVPIDDFTTNEKTNIKAAGGSYYTEIGGSGRTQTQSVEGEFMRVQTTNDWTKARVQESVFGGIATTPTKVNLDSVGIGSVEGLVKGVLDEGVINGHYTGDFNPVTSAPDPEDISEADKNAGILRNVTGRAKYAQAIRQVFIQINLEV